MNRIQRRFAALRKRGDKAFIAYVTGCYPDRGRSLRVIEELCRNGVDIIEIGLPFSDPVADGPTIQASSEYALRRGVRTRDVFALISRARGRGVSVPLVIMTYYNPVLRCGIGRFVARCRRAGCDGLIVPDLPLEESLPLRTVCARAGVDLILLVAPTTPAKRAAAITRASRGFVYYVSVAGITGTRRSLPAGIKAAVSGVKKGSTRPVCVGFGVSQPAQVRALCTVADGVIVGSALIKKMTALLRDPRMPQKVGAFARALVEATRSVQR